MIISTHQPEEEADIMRWLLVSAALVLSIRQLISMALKLRSARSYDEHMPDLEGIISTDSP